MTNLFNAYAMFSGLHTALITPFTDSNALDLDALRRLIAYQLEGGVDGIVLCGTTGESPTFSDQEFLELLETSKEMIAGRCKLIAGVGSNDTRHVVHRAALAERAGADGLLVVTPYYNKPTQDSLFAHYTHVADRVKTPIMLYNVPGRTSVNLLPATVARLAAHPQIRAVKEACGDINQVMELLAAVPAGFEVLSGDDAMTLPMIALGAHGLVSVASNEAPALLKAYTNACLSGDFERARALHFRLLPLMKINFIESNPAPVKFAMHWLGYSRNTLRLPLTPLSARHEAAVVHVLQQLALKRI